MTNPLIVGDDKGIAYNRITGQPVTIHGHPAWVPDPDRHRRIHARITRMMWEVDVPPECIIVSPDICGLEIDHGRGERPILVAPVRCDPTLPPNSIIFEGAGLADAESPPAARSQSAPQRRPPNRHSRT